LSLSPGDLSPWTGRSRDREDFDAPRVCPSPYDEDVIWGHQRGRVQSPRPLSPHTRELTADNLRQLSREANASAIRGTGSSSGSGVGPREDTGHSVLSRALSGVCCTEETDRRVCCEDLRDVMDRRNQNGPTLRSSDAITILAAQPAIPAPDEDVLERAFAQADELDLGLDVMRERTDVSNEPPGTGRRVSDQSQGSKHSVQEPLQSPSGSAIRPLDGDKTLFFAGALPQNSGDNVVVPTPRTQPRVEMA